MRERAAVRLDREWLVNPVREQDGVINGGEGCKAACRSAAAA